MSKISNSVERKFTGVFDASEWEIDTDSGFQPLIDVKQTVKYEVWHLKLDNGQILNAADDHILFDENYNEIFVKDLKIGDLVQTKSGLAAVVVVENTGQFEHMYDVGVDSEDHRFYSNDILSHNTTCAAGYLLWYSMFNPDSTILIAAHKYTGSQEIMNRIRFGYENVPNFVRAGATSYNKGSIEFDNGSRIVSATTTETTGRGMSLTLVYADEFAFVLPRIAKEFWTSISPTLSTGGKCIITSTPNSDEDQFSDIWREANKTMDEYGNKTSLGKNGFFAFKADWREHPERDDTWAREEQSRIGLEKFKREHDLEFIIATETLIDPMKLSRLRPSDPLYKTGQVRWYKKPSENKIYLLSLDPSLGTGGDQAAIEVFELPGLVQVAEWQHNKTPIEQQVNLLRQLTNEIKENAKDNNSIYYTVENNTLGEAALVVIRDIGEDKFAGLFLSERGKNRKGFTTTNKEKLAACAKLKHFIETDRMTVNSASLITELKNYEAKGNSFCAKWGETDDLVSATLLVIRMANIVSEWNQTIYESMRENLTEEDMPMPMVFTRYTSN